jgi:hypothetical protein
MFVSSSQVSVLCDVQSEDAVEISCKKTSNNLEEQCDMQNQKIKVWEKTSKAFIWKTCQSTLTVSVTINVVWQETPCIYLFFFNRHYNPSWVSACSIVVDRSQQGSFTECRCQRHVKPPTWRRTFATRGPQRLKRR